MEGYIESTASGLCCGINMARQLRGLEPIAFPQETALGALSLHVSQQPGVRFDPMNINFGIIKSPDTRIRNKQERYTAVSRRALDLLETLRPRMEEDLQS